MQRTRHQHATATLGLQEYVGVNHSPEPELLTWTSETLDYFGNCYQPCKVRVKLQDFSQ